MKLNDVKNFFKKPAFLYPGLTLAILAIITGIIWLIAQVAAYLDV